MEEKDKSFVVKDKRFFNERGEARPTTEVPSGEGKNAAGRPATEEADAADKAAAQPQGGPQTHQAGPSSGQPREEELPEVSFASFVISLSTTAMFHFGDFADPQTGRGERNLPAAKQMIDILGILKEKTRGNLDENERNLLYGILYDLRMRYVKEKTSR